MIIEEKYFKVAGELILREIENDFIVIPITGELSKKGSLFKLNKSAAEIWEFIYKKGETNINQINKYICMIYMKKEEEIMEDTHNIINIFIRDGLVEWV